ARRGGVEPRGAPERRPADVGGLPAQRQLDPARGPEEVRDEREVGAADALEEEGGPAASDDPLRDLGNLEPRVHLGAHPDELPAPLEVLDEASQVLEVAGPWPADRSHRQIGVWDDPSSA